VEAADSKNPDGRQGDVSRVGLAPTPIVVAVIVLGSLFPAVGAGHAASGGGEEPPPPVVTVNEFLPEDRDLGDCLSALPKPDCGSKAHGGWRQGLVLGAILAGLGVIVWRIVVSSRRARAIAAADPEQPEGDVGVSSDEPEDRRRTPPSH